MFWSLNKFYLGLIKSHWWMNNQFRFSRENLFLSDLNDIFHRMPTVVRPSSFTDC